MMTDGEYTNGGVGIQTERCVPVEDPTWVVAKSLLEVNDRSSTTLQEFLYYVTTDRLDELPADDLEARIDELIEVQTRTLAELELAKDAIVQVNTE